MGRDRGPPSPMSSRHGGLTPVGTLVGVAGVGEGAPAAGAVARERSPAQKQGPRDRGRYPGLALDDREPPLAGRHQRRPAQGRSAASTASDPSRYFVVRSAGAGRSVGAGGSGVLSSVGACAPLPVPSVAGPCAPLAVPP
jgi:hypothetical protein